MSRIIIALLLTLLGCSDQVNHTEKGVLVVYSTIDTPLMKPLIEAFESQNPRIEVKYHSLAAADVTDKYVEAREKGLRGPDLLINSAMDLQIKLANDGAALPYKPLEAEELPSWSFWRQSVYAIAVEPIVIGYNRTALPEMPASLSRAQLTSLLQEKSDAFVGKVGLYDPQGSSTGMLLINQDLEADPANWELIRSIGMLRPRLYTSSREMIDDISSGRLVLAYGIFGSYAFQQASRDPRFQVVMPNDYTLLASRVALIPKSAQNAEAARSLLDFLLSKQGQQLIASQGMIPVRLDTKSIYPELTGIPARAIKLSPALLANRDRLNTANFLRRWRTALEPQVD